jgi:acyl-CoA thioesterase-2
MREESLPSAAPDAVESAARRRALFDHLLSILDLEPAGADRFIGRNEIDRHGRIYGGQAIAQALMAAARCVPHSAPASAGGEPLRRAHSLHAYFLLLGDPSQPVEFEVTRLRDGRSFSQRLVTARQKGRPILEMLCSFHIDDSGYEHALPMPAVPGPESLRTPEELVRDQLASGRIPPESRWAAHPRSIEMRHSQVPAYMGGGPGAEPGANWFRTPIALPDDPILHQCVIAYTTDMSFNDHAARRHGWSGPLGAPDMTSLDHAVWFHAPARADDWLLFCGTSPFGGRARGFVRGEIFTRSGRMVASVAQECLLRPHGR